MSDLAARNRRMMLALVAGVGVLTALALGSAPLYEIYCRITGFSGTPKVAAATGATVVDRTMTVSLNADTAPELPWRFASTQREVKVRLGEPVTVHFTATNVSNRPLVGKAVASVTSDQVAVYVDEVACFCFTEQLLKPGETADFPVTFFVDAKLADDQGLDGLNEISLSYMFFVAKSDRAKNMLAHLVTADSGKQ